MFFIFREERRAEESRIVPYGIQLTAMSETRSLRSLRVMPLAFGSSVGFPSTTNRY